MVQEILLNVLILVVIYKLLVGESNDGIMRLFSSAKRDSSHQEEYSFDEKVVNPYLEFDKRIERMKKEVGDVNVSAKVPDELVYTPLEERIPGEIYNIPPDEEIPSLYDDSDVEIITPEYEKFVEQNAFRRK